RGPLAVLPRALCRRRVARDPEDPHPRGGELCEVLAELAHLARAPSREGGGHEDEHDALPAQRREPYGRAVRVAQLEVRGEVSDAGRAVVSDHGPWCRAWWRPSRERRTASSSRAGPPS